MTDDPGSPEASRRDGTKNPVPAYSGEEAYVFVCYSHQDSARVDEELRWLQGAGVNVWYDEGIGAGTVWRAELASVIEHAKLVLFFASPSSVASEHCSRELSYALECSRPILPVYLESAELPADLRLGLSRVQAIHRHALAQERYREKILDAISGARRLPLRTASPVAASRNMYLALAAALLIAAGGAWLALDMQFSSGGASVQSLAVLPFDNLSNEPGQEYFVAGMHDAVITELSRVRPLRVISRTSTLAYQDSRKSIPEIARELNVDGIVEASVLKANGTVRIQVQLIQAFPEEKHLWANAYDRDIGDVLALHTDVASAIAQAVEANLTPEHRQSLSSSRPVDPATYEAYLRGRYHVRTFTPEGFQKGLAYFNEAIANDPADPLPYAGLALAYGDIGHTPTPPSQAFPKARAAALKALALDDTLAEAHLALAEAQLYYEWDADAGLRSLMRAIELNPNLAAARAHYGWYLDYAGRYEEAAAEMERAVELDPLDPLYSAWLGWWYWWTMRDLEAAEREASSSLELNPNYPIGLYVLGGIYSEAGRHQEAIAVHAKASAAAPQFRWALAASYAAAGRSEEARTILAELSHDNAEEAWGRAYVLVELGDKDGALRALEAAYEHRHQFMLWLDRVPTFQPLHGEPAFEALVRRIKERLPGIASAT